jgi:hypothetical protein
MISRSSTDNHPGADPNEPLTLFDVTRQDQDDSQDDDQDGCCGADEPGRNSVILLDDLQPSPMSPIVLHLRGVLNPFSAPPTAPGLVLLDWTGLGIGDLRRGL